MSLIKSKITVSFDIELEHDDKIKYEDLHNFISNPVSEYEMLRLENPYSNDGSDDVFYELRYIRAVVVSITKR